MKFIPLIAVLILAGIVSGKTVLPENDVRLVVSLSDGSRLIGGTTLVTMPLRSEALGKVEVPLAKMRLIEFSKDHESVTLSLANGDKLRGAICTTTLPLKTLVGKLTIPLDLVQQIELRAGGSRLVEWNILPFPMNSDWPGPRGEPAQVTNRAIILRGQPVRTKQTYSAPLRFECEVTLEDLRANDGCLWIALVPEDSDPNLDPPASAVTVTLGYHQRDGGGGHLSLDQGRHSTIKLSQQPFTIAPGKTYRLGIEVLPEGLRVTLNDAVYEANAITLPPRAFHIRMMGWQPANTWRVQNFTVR